MTNSGTEQLASQLFVQLAGLWDCELPESRSHNPFTHKVCDLIEIIDVNVIPHSELKLLGTRGCERVG